MYNTQSTLTCTYIGVYEVGVHIADVTYFVKTGTALDAVARQRATSVYLVQKVTNVCSQFIVPHIIMSIAVYLNFSYYLASSMSNIIVLCWSVMAG